MSFSKPTVSIIMATFNRAHLIKETLDSILNQSYENWECLIIDDGSSDKTREIVANYILKTDRFKYFERTLSYQKGLPGCRNFGLDIAKGNYIIFFDDDDIVHPDNLLICVKELNQSNTEYCRFLRNIFTGEFSENFNRDLVYESNNLDISNLDDIITGIIPFNSCQVLWKKECFTDNRFEESLMYAEEWECYSRILATGINGINIRKVLFYGRKHPNSNTGEFWNKNNTRRESKLRAVRMVVKHLKLKGNLSLRLKKYFLQLGIFLEEESIITYVLETTEAKRITKLKYKILYKYYPYIVWMHRLKKRIKQKNT